MPCVWTLLRGNTFAPLQLQGTPQEAIWRTLQLFAYGTFMDYTGSFCMVHLLDAGCSPHHAMTPTCCFSLSPAQHTCIVYAIVKASPRASALEELTCCAAQPAQFIELGPDQVRKLKQLTMCTLANAQVLPTLGRLH